MKKIFLLLVFLSSFHAFSQGEDNDYVDYDGLDKLVIFPSPTPSRLINLQNNDVNLYQGKITESLPLFDFKSGDISVPIVLNYSSSGVKVNEISGWMGVGWNLQAGGQIVRVMKGLPDEYDSDLKKTTYNSKGENIGNYIEGFGYKRLVEHLKSIGKEPFNYMSPDNVMNQLPDAEQAVLIKRASFYHQDNVEAWDTQPDEFYFNFGGYSGKFCFNADGEIITIPKYNFIIDYTLEQKTFEDRTYHVITGFNVTTDDGFKYYFGSDEKNATEYTKVESHYRPLQFIPETPVDNKIIFQIGDICQYKFNPKDLWSIGSPGRGEYSMGYTHCVIRHFSSTWHLTQIISPTNNSVNFKYNKLANDLNYIQAQNDNIYFSQVKNSSGFVFTPMDYYNEVLTITYTQVKQSNIVLQSIESNNRAIQFYSTSDRKDLIDGSKLNKIKLFNHDICIKSYEFKFEEVKSNEPRLKCYNIRGLKDYNNEPVDKRFYVDLFFYNGTFPGYVEEYKKSEETRMYLVEMIEIGSDNRKMNPYKFNYYDKVIPPRFSPLQDVYGYYNHNYYGPFYNVKNQNGVQLIPNFRWSKEYYYTEQDGNGYWVDEVFRIQTSSIDLIKNGMLFSIQYPTGGIKSFNYELNTNGSGGLRVHDVINDFGNGSSIQTTYTYFSNLYGYPPSFAHNDYKLYTCRPKTNFYGEDKIMGYLLNSTPVQNVPDNHGYDVVKQYTDQGYIQYEFDSYYDKPDEDLKLWHRYNSVWQTTSTGFESNFEPSYDNSWQRGVLREVSTYSDNSPYPVHQIQYVYKPANQTPQKNYSLIESIYKLAHFEKVSETVNNIEGFRYKLNNVFDILRLRYKYHCANNLILDKTIEYTYDQTRPDKRTAIVKGYSYDSERSYVINESIYNSLSINDIMSTFYKYPWNSPNSDPYIQNLINENRLKEVIQKNTYKNGNPIGVKKTEYKKENNIILPYIIKISGTDENGLKDEYKISKNDDRGNILEITQMFGSLNSQKYFSYIWAYDKTYPVAKIENSTYQHVVDILSIIGSSLADIETKSTGENDEMDLILLFNALRKNANMKDALITSYTYDPLIGIRSETDPSGKTTYYEYDGLGRLILARDQNNNIVKSYDYHYKTE